jgi:hypothetical protein
LYFFLPCVVLVRPEKAQINLAKNSAEMTQISKRRQEDEVNVKKKRTRGPSTYRPEGRRKGKEERKGGKEREAIARIASFVRVSGLL